MKSIKFIIDENEIRKVSKSIIKEGEMAEILTIVENDPILWNDIQKSINSAIVFMKLGKSM